MKIKVYLRKEEDTDGLSLVNVRVAYNGHRSYFSTNVKCAKEKWNADNECVRGNSKQAKDDNLVIEKVRSQINDIFVRYRLQNREHELEPDLLKKEYQNPAVSIDFYTFMKQMIKDRRGEIAESTAILHTSILAKLKEYQPVLHFSELTPLFIERFSRYLKVTMGNNQGTIHNNLKIIKTYVNLAVRRGILRKTPFDEIKIKHGKSNPEYLTKEELSKLFELYYKKTFDSTYQNILRAYLFCCLTGLRISDIQLADHSWVIGGNLVFTPLKGKNVTNQTLKIPLGKKALKLIDDTDTSYGKIFRTYSEPRMRTYIKALIGHCKIKKDVSWHSSRHTFATLFLDETNDLATLQKLLGHASITQTMKYAHVSEQKKIEQINIFDKSLDFKFKNAVQEPK